MDATSEYYCKTLHRLVSYHWSSHRIYHQSTPYRQCSGPIIPSLGSRSVSWRDRETPLCNFYAVICLFPSFALLQPVSRRHLPHASILPPRRDVISLLCVASRFHHVHIMLSYSHSFPDMYGPDAHANLISYPLGQFLSLVGSCAWSPTPGLTAGCLVSLCTHVMAFLLVRGYTEIHA